MNAIPLLRPALVLLAGFTVLTGIAYPLLVTGIARSALPVQAGGSLVVDHGTVRGSTLIGQTFRQPGYFHGRPSATTHADPADASKSVAAPNNAAASTGSNLGPTSQALRTRMAADLKSLQLENPGQPVPPELLQTSASGLDPDLSPAAALYQVPRIAQQRHLDPAVLAQLITTQTRRPLLDFVGEPTVNVLQLNRALDALH